MLPVNLEHVRVEPLRPGCLVLAEGAGEGLDVRVEVPPQAPAIHAPPGAVGAGKRLGSCRAARSRGCCLGRALALGSRRFLRQTGGAAAAHDGLRPAAAHCAGRTARVEAPGLHASRGAAVGGRARRPQGPGAVGGARTAGRLRQAGGSARPLAIVAVVVAAGRVGRVRGRAGRVAPDEADVIGVVLVDAQKVLLDVVGSVEQLEANIAVERLVVLVDVLVPVVQVPPVGGVRAAGAHVPLVYRGSGRGRSEPPRTAGRLRQVLEVLQQPHDLVQQGLVAPQGRRGILNAVHFAQVQSDAPRPGAAVRTLGALEHLLGINMGPQVVLSNSRQKSQCVTGNTPEHLCGRIVGGHWRAIPAELILALHPAIIGRGPRITLSLAFRLS